ncbi:MAG: 4Fe-4S binding protein [Actinomycetota bacterium]
MRFKDFRFKMTVRLWPLGNLGKKVARLPGLRRLVGPRLWNEENLDATYVPVGEAVEVGPGSVVPYRIIEDLIGRASHRFILGGCLCRTGNRCREYPVDIGCVFLGDAAAEINPERGRAATAAEALEHVKRARERGLLPCVIHSSFDASLLDIEYRRMLAVCFCCNCCCTFRTDMRGGPVHYRDRIIRLPGLAMRSVGDCALCEKCARACFLGAVRVTGEGPVFEEFCKGCGRCADACPRNNIRIRLDPSVDTMGLLLARIGARTDIT